MGRTSMLLRRARGILAAIWMASLRSRVSIRMKPLGEGAVGDGQLTLDPSSGRVGLPTPDVR